MARRMPSLRLFNMSLAVPGPSFRPFLVMLLSSFLTLCIAGCGIGTAAAPKPVSLTVNGRVHGGQQPVVGAQIQLYAAGNTGNGSAASPLLQNAVTSGQDGTFSITADYACQSPTSQVYLVATQGNPGLGAGGNNPALVMMAALGSCGNLTPTQFISMNEVTTVAAAWALAPFEKDLTHVGSSLSNYNLGLTNAFLNAQLIADTSTGNVATLPSNLTTETGKIYALADAVAVCINSDGTTGCSPLFTAATPNGGIVPTNAWDALMNIVKNPGNNVVGVYNAIGPQPPFATTLTQSPNDWTLSLTVTGGGLNMPTALGIDSQNNIWVANQAGPLSAFGPQGTPLSSTGFGFSSPGHSYISQVYGLAIDPSDNIWVTNFNGGSHAGSVTEFYGVKSGSPGSSPQTAGFSDSSIQYPYALAADTNGNIFIANTGNSSASVYTSSGTLLYGDLGANSMLPVIPQGIAVDANHGFWLPGGNTVAHISAPSTSYPNGQLLSNTNCCALSYGVATDAQGNLWVADYLGGTSPNNNGAFADLATDGSILVSNATVGGINHPAMVAVDASQNVWFTNLIGASITEIAGNGSAAGVGTAISPSVGAYGVGGYGLDASLHSPLGIAPDRSGNIWVSNQGANAITMFFGLATPTVTPLQAVPTAP
jgi:hypothetical protein